MDVTPLLLHYMSQLVKHSGRSDIPSALLQCAKHIPYTMLYCRFSAQQESIERTMQCNAYLQFPKLQVTSSTALPSAIVTAAAGIAFDQAVP